MNAKPHADYAKLKRAITNLSRQGKLRAWTGDSFRFAKEQYAGRKHFLSGLGAQMVGGRWNAPKSFPVLYTSTTPETATKEVFAYGRRNGFPDSAQLRLILDAVNVTFSRVLDLTDLAVLTALGVTAKEVRNTDWWSEPSREALTQAIGRAAYMCKVEAILAPSAQEKDGENLIIFPGRLLPSSVLKMVPKKRNKRP